MTRSRYRIFETEYPYFLTWTIVGWLPVVTRNEAVNIVFDSWRFLQRERGFKLFGYVILENHVHLIASAPELSDVVQRSKSFIARQLIDLLESRAAKRRCWTSLEQRSYRIRPRVNIRCGRKGAIHSRFRTTT